MARIATFTSGPPTGTGGTDRHLASMARALTELGHEVDHYHFEMLVPPRPWTLLDRLGFRHPNHGYYLYQMALARPAYDLLIVNSYMGAYIPKGRPVINFFHSCDAAYAEQTRASLSWKEYFRRRIVWAWFEKRSGRRHFPVAVSPSLARELQQYYRLKVKSVVPCCVSEAFSPGDQEAARQSLGWNTGDSRPILLFAGTWCYRKGADLFARLAERLGDRARFIAVSQTGDWDVPIHPAVQMLVDVPSGRMPEVFRAADLFVFPSRGESFGLVTVEAMATGLALITTTAGVGDQLRQDPRLRPYVLPCPADFEALLELAVQMLERPDIRQELGAYAREFAASQFSYPGFRKNLEDLIAPFLTMQVINS